MIQVENLSKSYDHCVLRNLSFCINEGDVVGIYGPSGIGKTTLLHIMMGIIPCDSGILTGFNRKRAAVFQEDRLFDDFSALDNIRFVSNQSKEMIEKELIKVIPELDVSKKVKDLSGGMKRRVCIVRALITGADIIFMDEPFKGLDEENKQATIQYVIENKRDRTFFVVSHDKNELEMLKTSKIIRLKERG